MYNGVPCKNSQIRTLGKSKHWCFSSAPGKLFCSQGKESASGSKSLAVGYMNVEKGHSVLRTSVSMSTHWRGCPGDTTASACYDTIGLKSGVISLLGSPCLTPKTPLWFEDSAWRRTQPDGEETGSRCILVDRGKKRKPSIAQSEWIIFQMVLILTYHSSERDG